MIPPSPTDASSRHANAHGAAAVRDPLDWAASAGAVQDVLREMHVRIKRRRRKRVGVAAGAVGVLALIGFTWQGLHRAPAMPEVPSSIVVSTPARQTLSDGSVVELKNGAKITLAFTDSVRRVIMEQGEAHFEVAKHQPRPFVVTAGGLDFRAVGTAFGVVLGTEKVEMVVTEGRVAVERAGGSPSASGLTTARTLTVVEVGNRVVLDMATPAVANPTVRAVPPTEMNQRMAWRAPKLEFSGTPLLEAVAMINRQVATEGKPQLVLGDESLGSIRLTGILRADNVDTLLSLLGTDYGIGSQRNAEGNIVLRKGR